MSNARVSWGSASTVSHICGVYCAGYTYGKGGLAAWDTLGTLARKNRQKLTTRRNITTIAK